jgi:hypothetical protein
MRKRYDNNDKDVPGYDDTQNYSRTRGYYRGNTSPSMSPAPHHAASKKIESQRNVKRSRSRSYERDAKNNDRSHRSSKYEAARESGRNKFSDRPREIITSRQTKKTGFHDY